MNPRPQQRIKCLPSPQPCRSVSGPARRRLPRWRTGATRVRSPESCPNRCRLRIDGRAQADYPGDVRRACFKLVRQVVVQGFFKGDHLDHVAPAVVRRHIFQQGRFRITRRFRWGRTVYGRRRYRSHNPGRPHPASYGAPPGPPSTITTAPAAWACAVISAIGLIVPRALGDMDNRNNPGSLTQQLFVFVHVQFTGVIDGDDFQHRAGLFAQQLPGDDIGVVFHRGDDDFIPGAQPAPAVALRDQVYPLRGAAYEYGPPSAIRR